MIRILLIVSTAAALSIPSGNSRSKALKVWDNVLPKVDQRVALHEYASKSGLEHKCFSRPLAKDGRNNIIEHTLDAILSEMEGGSGDDSIDSKQYVEYWTRQEWRHIEAHADVDENLSKQMDQNNSMKDDARISDFQSKYSTTYQSKYGHRYPAFGHVLYLQVGTDVQGPTCIFPGRSSGGDLSQAIHEKNTDEECSDASGNVENAVQLITVPAVAGRLLRFDGRDLHAVPRPVDLWMLPFVKGGAEYEPEEVWGRSVILFNVWPAGEDPPLGVPLNGNAEDSSTTLAEDTFCNSFDNWNEAEVDQKVVPSSSSNTETNQSVKVWLLGNERRRDHPLRTVALKAPAEGGRDAVRQALSEKSKVSELVLQQQ